MKRSEILRQKADELLALGDSLGRTKPAESRRILRECRRYRRMTREAEAQEATKPLSDRHAVGE